MVTGLDHFLRAKAVAAETDRHRILLYIPYWCGLNDVLVQIWKSYKYGIATNRHLPIDTRASGFWDDFDNYFIPTNATQVGPIPNDVLDAIQVFTVTTTEDSGGQPLHNQGVSRNDKDRRRLNTNMLVDLLCLASSRELLITASQPQCCNSGFSGLAMLLHDHPNLINQLVGTTTQSKL